MHRCALFLLMTLSLPAAAQEAQLAPPTSTEEAGDTTVAAGVADDSPADVTPAGAPTPEPAPAKKKAAKKPEVRALRVAVMDLEVSDIDDKVAKVTVSALLEELRKLDRVSVISLDEIRAMLSLEEQRQMAGCDESSCLADLAGALGADIVIIGNLAKVGNENVIGLRAIDQNQGSAVGSYSARLVPADGEEFLAAVGPAVEELFPQRALRKGKKRGVSDEVALRLNPPPLDPWTVYAASGVGVAFGGLAALSLSANLLVGFVMNIAISEAGPDGGVPISKREIDGLFTAANVTLGTAAVTGAVAAAGIGSAIVMSLFTDWDGARAASDVKDAE